MTIAPTMAVACLAFTRQGEVLANRIKSQLPHKIEIFTKGNLFTKGDFKENKRQVFQKIFQTYDGIIFVCSTGIAVRFIAPFVHDKTTDPAVVVVDDCGRYSISLLSGHLGGANSLAREVAGVLDAQPVITTASDGRGIEAVDMFAKRRHLLIDRMEDAKILTAMMIEGKRIQVVPEQENDIGYANTVQQDAEGTIAITSQDRADYEHPFCVLRPRDLIIGIGCRRGKPGQEIRTVIQNVFKEHNISLKCIKTVASIDIKKDEPGILEVCRELGCELKIFSSQEVSRVQHLFEGSSFVLKNIGVTSVAEPCAYLAGGDIIVKKTAVNGVTLAVARVREINDKVTNF